MKKIVYRSRAPLRISFAGGGTDISPYPELYGGAVLSSTIDMFSYTSIKLNAKKMIKIESQDFETTETIKNQKDLKKNDKFFLIRSIIQNLNKKSLGMDITLFSDVKIGSGLGASSSLTVGLIGNLLNVLKIKKTPNEIAKLAYKIERDYCLIKGGYQDQYSASFGGFNFIEFKKNNVKVIPLKLHDDVMHEMLSNLILCDTNQYRKEKIYDKIISAQSILAGKNNKETEILHKIKDISYEMKNSLLKGDLDYFSKLLDDGWKNKQKLSSEISTNKINKIYEKVKTLGVKGGKLLGAGGGGYMILYCDMEKKNDIIKNLQRLKLNIVKFNFEKSGLVTWSKTE